MSKPWNQRHRDGAYYLSRQRQYRGGDDVSLLGKVIGVVIVIGAVLLLLSAL